MGGGEVDFKESSKHQETSVDVVPKLDPHGFPLQPQPSDDPLGETSGIASLLRPLTVFVLISFCRPSQLE